MRSAMVASVIEGLRYNGIFQFVQPQLDYGHFKMSFREVFLLMGFIIVDLENVKSFVFESERVSRCFLLFANTPAMHQISGRSAIFRHFNKRIHGMHITIWCERRSFFILGLFHL